MGWEGGGQPFCARAHVRKETREGTEARGSRAYNSRVTDRYTKATKKKAMSLTKMKPGPFTGRESCRSSRSRDFTTGCLTTN